MGRFLVLLLVALLLAGSHLAAYRAGLGRGAREAGPRALPGAGQLPAVLRAARRVAAADPSMPTDASLRQQELAMALDEYDLAKEQLE